MEAGKGLNGQESASENSSHLNPIAADGPRVNLAMLAIIERDALRAYVRRTLGFYRDLQTVLGGSVLADLIKDGDLLLDHQAHS